MTKPSTIILLSGGLDSSTLLARAVAENKTVETIAINYGQRHLVELKASQDIARHFGVPHDIVDLTALTPFLSGSALTDDVEVPDGHYAEETMKATVVPNRNAIMLSVAAGIAVARGAAEVGTAVHAGDHFIYPDCRPSFIETLSQAFTLGTDGFGDVEIWAPFVNRTKAQIAFEAAELHLPIDLTWSCYKGSEIHCGACGTCYERREAFDIAGVIDPTIYESQPEYAAPKAVGG